MTTIKETQPRQKEINFYYMDSKEILLAYLTLIINKSITSPLELQKTILNSYVLGGISQQQANLVKLALKVNKIASKSKYKNSDIRSLLESVYKNSYIGKKEFYILISLMLENNLITKQQRESILNRLNIAFDYLPFEDLIDYLETLKNL